MSALRHKQTFALQKATSASPPIATVKADLRDMSALLLEADMCSALANVGYGPKADIGSAIRFDQSKCNIVVDVHRLALPAHRFRQGIQ
jgi:hypothetical protein